MRGTAEETRRRILKAAGKLFYDHGIRNVSVDAVAEEAEVTKRTIYYHFKGKDALVAAYLEARNAPVLAGLQRAMTSVEGSAIEQTKALFAMLAEQVKSPAWKGCPFARAVAELPAELDHPALEIAANHKSAFEAWLRERFAADGFDDPSLLARQILVLLDGAITEMLIHRDPAYAEAAAAAAAILLSMHGVSVHGR
jgi:AcrR family transcriptional regulator